MRILLDITHPAHVHFFRNAIGVWQERGHDLSIVAREKDIATDLLDRLGLPYLNLGRARSGLLGLGVELLSRNTKLLEIVRKTKPHVLTGIGGIYVAHVGAVSRIPVVVFTDTENATLSNRLTFPFATAVVTPRCYKGRVPARKHITYPGYHELAYTHPKRFERDPSVLEIFDLKPGEPFIVMRLVSWGAAHDISDRGFTHAESAVKELQQFGKVLISSERPLPPSLEPHRINCRPELIHHLLSFANLFIGESATMASESATLGTPAILVSTSRRGYTNEQEERYDLTYTFSDREGAQDSAVKKAVEILRDSDSKENWLVKRQQMLADMTDVTAFVADLVESYGHTRKAPAGDL